MLNEEASCYILSGLSGTHYVDIVGHNNNKGLKVTDPQRSTTSNLKETELRS